MINGILTVLKKDVDKLKITISGYWQKIKNSKQLLFIVVISPVVIIAIVTYCLSESQDVASTMFSGILAFAGSMFLGCVAIWQNERLSKQNQELIELNKKMTDLNRELENIQEKTWMISSQKSIPFLRIDCNKTNCYKIDKSPCLDIYGYHMTGSPEYLVTSINLSATFIKSDFVIRKNVGLTVTNYSDARIESINLYMISVNNIKNKNDEMVHSYAINHKTSYLHNVLDSGERWHLDLNLYYTTDDNFNDICSFTLYFQYKTITGYIRYQQVSIMCSSTGILDYHTITGEERMEPIIECPDAVKEPYNFN